MDGTPVEIIKPNIVKNVPHGTNEIIETVSSILYGAAMLIAGAKSFLPQVKNLLKKGNSAA